MNDFDFEELDKAVNDLATKTHDEHGGPDPKDVPATVAVSTTSQPAVAEGPTQPEPVPVVPRSVPQPTEPTAAPAAAMPQKHSSRLSDTRPHSRGSFMDIVPPASRKPGGRMGVSIQPLSKPEEVVPEESKKEPEMSAPAAQDVPASEPKPDVPTPQPDIPKPAESEKKSDDVTWPDPLDFGGDQKEKPEAPATPFLAEAKVEKRPLGAFSNFKAALAPEPKAEEKVPEPDEPKPQDELTPEKDGTFKEPEQPAEPKAEEKDEAESPKLESPEEPAKPDLHGKAMMSIPQQYHTEAKPTDKAARPVFDTKEYHPPLIEATSHEHRGGGGMWGKIFIAFVVLVLLAASGYFAYLYFVQK